LHVGFLDAQRVRECRALAAQERLLSLLHALREVLAVTLDVLVYGALDKLGLLEARHQRGVADLLLGGLMNLDRGLCTQHGITRYFGTADGSMWCWCWCPVRPGPRHSTIGALRPT
jgi:hypothetical protein